MSDKNKFGDYYTELSSGIAWSIFCSFASIIMAIIALAKCAPSSQLHADYIGVIVGILALLVTALVGWQIYNAIGMQEAVKKFDRLQKDFEESNRLLKLQDQRNITLIEAFALYYEAEKENDSIATKYRIYVEALLSFIQSNVPIGNQYVINARTELHGALDALERNANSFDKKHLVDLNSTMEDTFDLLIDATKARQEEVSQFLKEIKSLRDRRRDLVKRFKEEN